MPEITQITGRVGTTTVSIGTQATPALTLRSQFITADWKTNLIMEGLAFRVTVGTITPGGEVAFITGGGNGTIIDQDQPELAIGVREGFFLVPLDIQVAVRAKLDADAAVADIIVAASRTEAVPTDGTKTTETPVNMLDGGPTWTGDAFSAYTADLTDYTVDELLAHSAVLANDNGVAANNTQPILSLHYEPAVPEFIAGPCGMYVHWGGTSATLGTCTAVVAVIPTSYLI